MGESPNNPLPDLSGLSAAEMGALTLGSLDHLHGRCRLRPWGFFKIQGDFRKKAYRLGCGMERSRSPL